MNIAGSGSKMLNVSFGDETRTQLNGNLNEQQIDRAQDIQERKINFAWGALCAGVVLAGIGLWLKAKE